MAKKNESMVRIFIRMTVAKSDRIILSTDGWHATRAYRDSWLLETQCTCVNNI